MKWCWRLGDVMLSHFSSIWSCMNKKHTVISVFLLRNAKFLNFKKKFVCLFCETFLEGWCPFFSSLALSPQAQAHMYMILWHGCEYIDFLLQLFITSLVLVFHSCLIHNKEDIVNRGPGETGPRDHEADDRQRFFRIFGV